MSTWAVTTSNDPLEFDTVNGLYNNCIKIDSNHFINFWAGSGNDGFVQVFTVNTSTWAVTTAGNRIEYDTVNGADGSCQQIDANHFLNVWSRASNCSQVFTINTSTWAVSTANSVFLISTSVFSAGHSSFKVDTNHFVVFYQGFDQDGFSQVITVNTTTWAVTTANDALEFDTQLLRFPSCQQIDSNHFINFWAGLDNDGYVQVFTVNTSTWAVTTASDALEFNTTQGSHNSCFKIDTNHFINFWAGLDNDGYVQVFTVNTSTWAVTTSNDPLEFDTVNGTYNSCYQVDSNHFINFWSGVDADGFTQVFEVNTSTWAVTTSNVVLEFDTVNGTYNSCTKIDDSHFINFWAGDGTDGFVQVFEVEPPAPASTFVPKITIY